MNLSLHGDDRLPRYQRMAEILRGSIAERRWKPGDRLPAEMDIARQYRVAPGTVRAALTRLVEEGLLERHQGRGTFVRKPSFDRSLFRFFRFRGESDEKTVPESRILRRETMAVPTAVAGSLELTPGQKGVFMIRLRILEGKPVFVEEIWLPLRKFRNFMRLDVEKIGPLLYPIYEAVCGEVVARAEETLTAESATPKTARLLNLPAGDPVIVIDRLARGYDGAPLEWRRSRGAAGCFRYHVEIS